MQEYRRRVPRQAAGWFGQCIVEDEPAAKWAECVVLDVSVIGAGVEVLGFARRDVVGRHVTVEVPAPEGASVSIRFTGEVGHAGVTSGGGLRIGLLFLGLSESERSILAMLEHMQVGW